MKRRIRSGAAALATVGLLTALAVPALADNGTDSSGLRAAVNAAGITTHLNAFQSIATANGGTRSAGTDGHRRSAEYIERLLKAAGYNVRQQPFSYAKWEQLGPTTFSAPGVSLVELVDYLAMDYSASGLASGPIVAVDLFEPPVVGGSTSGCEVDDFAGFEAGAIALLQRGGCTFAVKTDNTIAAGAVGVIIYNEGDPGRVDLFGGTLGGATTVPVLSTSYAAGQLLRSVASASFTVDSKLTNITTYNLLADTPTGRADRLVVAGGHLDSVPEGPGINDNGSGTAALLEVALQMAKLNIRPRNMVRFAFWSGEEDGLIGSEHYVAQLSKAQIRQHMANLNFDMIASPNYGRFIYDGDGSATPDAGPNGSDVIESIFEDYFAGEALKTAPTAFDGRSDYGPFIDAGIPAGGLFTGAEDIMTAAEADLFDGVAGVAFDACYHVVCDDISNINQLALGEMSDAVAHAVLSLAMSTSAINGTGQGNGAGSSDFEYKGSHAQK